MSAPLKDFSDNGLLELWVRSETNQQVSTKLAYYGFEANPDQVRRRVRAILKSRHVLPLGRRPTAKDYRRIKVAFLADWQDMEIL